MTTMASAGVCSWVTLATNDQYAAAALVLAHSLRSVSTAHRLTALITPSVSLSLRGAIGGVFDEVVCVDVLDSRDEANLALLRRPELGVTLTKLHAWRLTQYTKCVFLDADCLVMSNCDDLFERDELSAAPDIGWPDCFNSGVFVFTPSLDTFNALLRLAESTGSFDGGDQGLLNEFFNSWCTGSSERRLSFLYNMVVSVTYTCLPAFKRFGGDVKIVHFLGDQKPWRAPHAGVGDSPSAQFHQRWHQLYRDHVVPHLAHSQMRLHTGSARSLTVPLSSAGQSTQIGVCSLDTDSPCLPVDTCPATSYEHLPAAAAATAAFSEITRSYEDGGDSLVDDRTDSFVWRDPGQCIDSSDQVGGCSRVSSTHRQAADQSKAAHGQHNTNYVLDWRCYDDSFPFNRSASYHHTLFGIQGIPGCVDGIISVRERGELDEGLSDNVQTGSFCTSCGRSINTYINESSDELKSCWMAEDVVCDSLNKCPRAGMKTFSSHRQQTGTFQHSFNNDPVARCENIDMSQVSGQVSSKSNFPRRTAVPRRRRPFSSKCVMVTAGLRMVVKISRGAVVSAAVCVVREPGVKLRVVADGRPILVRLGVGGVPLSDRRVRNAFKRRGNAAACILISAKFISALLCGLRRQAFTESPSPHLAKISSPHGVTCSRQNSFSGPGVSANDSDRYRDDVHDRCCCSICCRLATNEFTAGHEDRQHRELSFDNSCHSLDQKPSRSRALLATCKRRGCGAALEGDPQSETKVELLSPSLSQLTVSDDADQTRRRSAWEYGQPDYMGADKFDSILAKIDQTMSRTDSEQ